MKAVIMAGGDGKRLRPLSCTMPKPMVPLLNKPVLGYCMELIKKHGFDEAILTLRYLPNVIRRYIGDGSAFGIKAECAVEDKPMGTAGGVKNALKQADDSVLIMSGDAMCDFDLTDAMREHRRSGAAATILLKKVKVPMEYGVVLKDKDGFISRFIEKPSAAEVFSDLVNTGIYIIEPSVLDMIPEGAEYDFQGSVPAYAAHGYEDIRLRGGRLLERHRRPYSIRAYPGGYAKRKVYVQNSSQANKGRRIYRGRRKDIRKGCACSAVLCWQRC